MAEYQLVDPFMNYPPEPGKVGHVDPNIARWFKNSKARLQGATVEEMVADMDEGGVQVGIVTIRPGERMAAGTSPWSVGQGITDESFDGNAQKLAAAIKQYPDRLRGAIGIDPTGMMMSVRQVERAV